MESHKVLVVFLLGLFFGGCIGIGKIEELVLDDCKKKNFTEVFHELVYCGVEQK